jgi:hypothetical protein
LTQSLGQPCEFYLIARWDSPQLNVQAREYLQLKDGAPRAEASRVETAGPTSTRFAQKQA